MFFQTLPIPVYKDIDSVGFRDLIGHVANIIELTYTALAE